MLTEMSNAELIRLVALDVDRACAVALAVTDADWDATGVRG